MDSQQISNWVQIITGVALLVGIGLVVWELQQTRTLMRTQLASESHNQALQRTSASLGDEPMKAWAAACDDPNSVTTEDKLVLHNLLMHYLGTVLRSREIESLGGFDNDRWKSVAESNFPAIFAIPEGRSFWKAVKTEGFVPREVVQLGDYILEQQEAFRCFPYGSYESR